MSRNFLMFALFIIIIGAIAFFAFRSNSLNFGKKATINGHAITLEIADSPAEQIKGLSNRNSLPENNGMLFIFGKSGTYPFWMKDMHFPIDIIFLQDNKVITIYENVPAFNTENNKKVQNLTLYSPKSPVNKVLELNAGKAKRLSIKEGDILKISL